MNTLNKMFVEVGRGWPNIPIQTTDDLTDKNVDLHLAPSHKYTKIQPEFFLSTAP